MPYVFDHLDIIREALKRSPFGLITDIDGTISQTAPTPQQAEVTPLCRRYLSVLCNHLALVAAISGREAAKVKSMIDIDGMVSIGNHGLERWVGGHSQFSKNVQEYLPVIEAVVKELSPLLAIEGLSIEDKEVTASIHYRLCPDHQSAKRDILAAIENSPHARSLRVVPESKYAINLIPPVRVDKGTATLDLIREYNLRGGVYLGDDITDIDAFRAIHAACRDLDFQGFAIGITSREMPEKLADEAGLTLEGVADVERFLKWLSETAVELN